MNTSEQINELASALAKAQGEIQNPSKDKVNPHFKSRYADIADGLVAVRPVLSKHGLSVVQATDIAEDGSVILRTRLMHASGQWLESLYPVGRLTKHMELGASMTYAKRQALFAMVGVAGDTDDMDGTDTGTSDKDVRPKPSKVDRYLPPVDEAFPGDTPARASSNAMKSHAPELWAEFERAMRAEDTAVGLVELKQRWMKEVKGWSPAFRNSANDLFEECKAAIIAKHKGAHNELPREVWDEEAAA
jgi:hypothetical protein